MNKLIVFTGPVHSEKSTKAAHMAQRFQRMGLEVVLVRARKSLREHERLGTLVTKNGVEFPSNDLNSVSDIWDVVKGADVVWIDEAMLFDGSGEQERLLFEIAQIRQHAIVIVSGLSATSEMEAFGTAMPILLATADEIIQCKSDCDYCGAFDLATRSVCLEEKDGQVLVGSEDKYKAACSDCWAKHAASVKAATID